MVVAAAAVESEAEPDGADGLGHVENIIDPVFLGDTAPLAIDHVVAQKPGGQLLLVSSRWQQVSGNLPDGELVVGQIFVKSLNDPVAPGPHGALCITLVAIAVGIAGGIEPFPGHALAVARGSEKAIDNPVVGTGGAIGKKIYQLLGGGRQAGEVERDTAKQRGFRSLGCGFQTLFS